MQRLKDEFSKYLILWTFDLTRLAFLETDASDYAVGACLLQRDPEDNARHLVGYYLRKIIAAELNYPIHDKELLAIVDAFEVWRTYLQGARFQTLVFSDYKNLTGFMKN